MLHLDLATARRLVNEAVAEKGKDYIYPFNACVYAVEADTMYGYVDDDGSFQGDAVTTEAGPACIVGVALHKGGVPLEWLLRNAYNGAASEILLDGKRGGLLTFSEDAAEWLTVVQGEQDAGMPWGRAVGLADRVKEVEDADPGI
jgi:hypothetical protein